VRQKEDNEDRGNLEGENSSSKHEEISGRVSTDRGRRNRKVPSQEASTRNRRPGKEWDEDSGCDSVAARESTLEQAEL